MNTGIRLKRGAKSKLPKLSYGEPAYVSDEKELYIGTEAGNIKLTNRNEIDTINEQLEHIAPLLNFNVINLIDKGINKGDNVSDIINEIVQESINSNKQTTIIIPFNCQLNNKIIIDMNYIKLKGDNVVLTTNNIVEGEAILITSSVFAPYSSPKVVIDGVSITNNSPRSNDTIGIKYETDNGEVAHVSIENCSISGYGKGELYGKSAYLIKHKNVNIFNCKRCVNVDNEAPNNNAENITFENSALFNSDLVVYNNFIDSDINFINCSLDYNKSLFFNKGKINGTNCHIEGRELTEIQLICEEYGAININNSFIVFHFPSNQNAQYNYIANIDNNASLTIKDSYMTGTLNIYDTFSTGDGYVELKNISAPETYVNNTKINENKNLIIDSNFSYSNIVDNISITKDTNPISDRFVGDNLKLTINNNLEIEKIWGGGSESAFSFFIDIKNGQWFDFKYKHKSDEDMDGQVTVNYYLANVKEYANGLHQVNKKELITTRTFHTSNDKNFVTEIMPIKIRNKKSIFNKVIVEFDLYLLNGLNKKMYLTDVFTNTY